MEQIHVSRPHHRAGYHVGVGCYLGVVVTEDPQLKSVGLHARRMRKVLPRGDLRRGADAQKWRKAHCITWFCQQFRQQRDPQPRSVGLPREVMNSLSA